MRDFYTNICLNEFIFCFKESTTDGFQLRSVIRYFHVEMLSSWKIIHNNNTC